MRCYFRVLPDDPNCTVADLRAAVEAVTDLYPAVSQQQPPTAHPRGGFSLFLALPKAEAEEILVHFAEQGWRPCI